MVLLLWAAADAREIGNVGVGITWNEVWLWNLDRWVSNKWHSVVWNIFCLLVNTHPPATTTMSNVFYLGRKYLREYCWWTGTSLGITSAENTIGTTDITMLSATTYCLTRYSPLPSISYCLPLINLGHICCLYFSAELLPPPTQITANIPFSCKGDKGILSQHVVHLPTVALVVNRDQRHAWHVVHHQKYFFCSLQLMLYKQKVVSVLWWNDNNDKLNNNNEKNMLGSDPGVVKSAVTTNPSPSTIINLVRHIHAYPTFWLLLSFFACVATMIGTNFEPWLETILSFLHWTANDLRFELTCDNMHNHVHFFKEIATPVFKLKSDNANTTIGWCWEQSFNSAWQFVLVVSAGECLTIIWTIHVVNFVSNLGMAWLNASTLQISAFLLWFANNCQNFVCHCGFVGPTDHEKQEKADLMHTSYYRKLQRAAFPNAEGGYDNTISCFVGGVWQPPHKP